MCLTHLSETSTAATFEILILRYRTSKEGNSDISKKKGTPTFKKHRPTIRPTCEQHLRQKMPARVQAKKRSMLEKLKNSQANQKRYKKSSDFSKQESWAIISQ